MKIYIIILVTNYNLQLLYINSVKGTTLATLILKSNFESADLIAQVIVWFILQACHLIGFACTTMALSAKMCFLCVEEGWILVFSPFC